MGWLLVIGVGVLLLGPLRNWAGRHWALLVSVVAGGTGGMLLGGFLVAKGGGPAQLMLIVPVLCAIACGKSGPRWLRTIEKDGKDDTPSR